MQNTFALLSIVESVDRFAKLENQICRFDDDAENPGTVDSYVRRYCDGGPQAIITTVSDSPHVDEYDYIQMLKGLSYDKYYEFSYGGGTVTITVASSSTVASSKD